MRDRMVIYGGWDSTVQGTASFLGDAWALSLDGDPHWTELDPAGPLPAGRDAMAAAYDPTRDRLVVFGGWSGEQMLGDTQFLSWGDTPDDASVTAHATVDPAAAHLSWDILGATGPRAAVFRRQPNTPWSSVSTVDGATSGVVQFVDDEVVPGARYAYKLVVASQRGGTVGGEVWVDVPTVVPVPPLAVAFALPPVAPNPVVARFTVSFALPDAAPARLDVFDVHGRRLFGREVGSLGAGSHRIDIRTAGQFPPGLYFLQLSQAGRCASGRVAISGTR